MSVTAAEIVWSLVGFYAACGVATALALLFGGLSRFDPLASAAPWRVKLVIAPGIVALWPVMARKALAPRAEKPEGGA